MGIEKSTIHISVVSPVYRAEKIVSELVKQIIISVSPITKNFEIILVNDASPDNSWEKIQEECVKDKRVKGINLTRNFGQHSAVSSGLELSNGEWIVVIDCDLQCPPAEILRLYEKVNEGYEIVFTKKKNVRGSFFHKLTSDIFTNMYSYLTGVEMEKSLTTMSLSSRNVVDEINKMTEQQKNHFFLLKWTGFKSTIIEIDHNDRYEGKSSYNIRKRLSLAIHTFLTFSDKPLRLVIKMGFYLSLMSGLFVLYKILLVLVYGTNVIGWASIMSMFIFFTGIIISVLGIIGLYVGKIFDEVKHRPNYIIKEKVNF